MAKRKNFLKKNKKTIFLIVLAIAIIAIIGIKPLSVFSVGYGNKIHEIPKEHGTVFQVSPNLPINLALIEDLKNTIGRALPSTDVTINTDKSIFRIVSTKPYYPSSSGGCGFGIVDYKIYKDGVLIDEINGNGISCAEVVDKRISRSYSDDGTIYKKEDARFDYDAEYDPNRGLPEGDTGINVIFNRATLFGGGPWSRTDYEIVINEDDFNIDDVSYEYNGSDTIITYSINSPSEYIAFIDFNYLKSGEKLVTSSERPIFNEGKNEVVNIVNKDLTGYTLAGKIRLYKKGENFKGLNAWSELKVSKTYNWNTLLIQTKEYKPFKYVQSGVVKYVRNYEIYNSDAVLIKEINTNSFILSAVSEEAIEITEETTDKEIQEIITEETTDKEIQEIIEESDDGISDITTGTTDNSVEEPTSDPIISFDSIKENLSPLVIILSLVVGIILITILIISLKRK